MVARQTSLSDVQSRFNSLDLHDSRLLDLQIQRRLTEPGHDVRIVVELLEGSYPKYVWVPGEIVFLDCTFIRLDFDLDMKLVCGHAIAGADCEQDSALKADLERTRMSSEDAPLSSYLHFRVALCPTSGELHLFARDFVLRKTSRIDASPSG